MKKYVSLLLVVFCGSCFSHRKVEFTGHLIEDLSEVPIPSVEIIINGSNGSVFKTLSDSLGGFTFVLMRDEQYQVQFNKPRFLSTAIHIKNVQNHERDMLVKLHPFVNRDYLPNFYFDSLHSETSRSRYDTLLADIFSVKFPFLLVGYSSLEEPESLAYSRALFVKKRMVQLGTDSNLIRIESRPKSFPQLRNHKFGIPSLDIVPGEDRYISDSTLIGLFHSYPARISAFMRQVQIERYLGKPE